MAKNSKKLSGCYCEEKCPSYSTFIPGIVETIAKRLRLSSSVVHQAVLDCSQARGVSVVSDGEVSRTFSELVLAELDRMDRSIVPACLILDLKRSSVPLNAGDCMYFLLSNTDEMLHIGLTSDLIVRVGRNVSFMDRIGFVWYVPCDCKSELAANRRHHVPELDNAVTDIDLLRLAINKVLDICDD